jgi:hypothetical protein
MWILIRGLFMFTTSQLIALDKHQVVWPNAIHKIIGVRVYVVQDNKLRTLAVLQMRYVRWQCETDTRPTARILMTALRSSHVGGCCKCFQPPYRQIALIMHFVHLHVVAVFYHTGERSWHCAESDLLLSTFPCNQMVQLYGNTKFELLQSMDYTYCYSISYGHEIQAGMAVHWKQIEDAETDLCKTVCWWWWL